MKRFFISIAFIFAGLAMMNAQSFAFEGKEDLKLNIGANFQSKGGGIISSLDYGLGESFSVGVQAGYLLSVSEIAGITGAGFTDKLDMKVRASAHLGQVLNLLDNLDIYPGLNLGLRNFGLHLGARYFFDGGFGVFSEIQFPIARYKTDAVNYDKLNNQFSFSIGASFDLNM
ncbi:MAG: hypothetical protein LBR48_00825 [Dysgonamonadaceae bacterium]|jgi:hypothetical protein|nr:hypothetical protein [Dysgonamonadaceae bacterium]